MIAHVRSLANACRSAVDVVLVAVAGLVGVVERARTLVGRVLRRTLSGAYDLLFGPVLDPAMATIAGLMFGNCVVSHPFVCAAPPMSEQRYRLAPKGSP